MPLSFAWVLLHLTSLIHIPLLLLRYPNVSRTVCILWQLWNSAHNPLGHLIGKLLFKITYTSLLTFYCYLVYVLVFHVQISSTQFVITELSAEVIHTMNVWPTARNGMACENGTQMMIWLKEGTGCSGNILFQKDGLKLETLTRKMY